MPIKINLLAEALAAEDLRRRDPVKRCVYIGAFLVVLSLAWFSSLVLEHMLKKEELTTVQAEIQQHTNEYSQVDGDLKKIADANRKLAALQELSTNRFLQGNLLNALQTTAIVPGVQVTRLKVEQAYHYTGGILTKTNGEHIILGRPPNVLETIDVSIDARASGDNPGDQVAKFKEAIIKQPYFKAMLETNGVQLTGTPSAPQTDPSGKPYVLFTVELLYPDQYRYPVQNR